MSMLFASEWNRRVFKKRGSFLQAFEWGTFQQRYGNTVVRVATDALAGQVLTQTLPLKMRYAYIPRGPVGEWDKESFAQWLVQFRATTTGGPIFLRTDPPYPNLQLTTHDLRQLGFRDACRAIQPKQNLIIDLQKNEEEILGEMHPKTRYNIRLAQRHGVRVGHASDFESFFRLLSATAGRQSIRLHPKRYYATMLETVPVFSERKDSLQHRVYVASCGGKDLATALVFYFGDRATYLHGGSTDERSDVMAPYALHWGIMQDAKTMGYAEYDLGGADEKRWPGITRFKKGFGGTVEEYPNAADLIFDSLRYRAYRLVRKMLSR